jgi:hypothetical protein
LDVAARLAEARPTIDDIEEYVAACRRLGYQNRDLTMHPTQVRDWYDAEEGLDLRALDLDHGILSAAASAAEDAARMQGDLVAELTVAWTGRGAAAAHEFVWRSCQAATAVSAAVRAAADAEAALRDALWQAVDAKAVATEAVDGRQGPQRAEWLAAAKTVTTGAGDVAAASELVDQQVKPFVDRDVGSDWLAAMRAAASSIDAAFDAAIARATAPTAVFGVPGDLGPRAESRGYSEAAGGGDGSVRTVPAAAVGSGPGPGRGLGPAAPAIAPEPPPQWSPPAEAAPVAAASAPLPPPAGAPSLPPPSLPSSSMPSSGDLGSGASSLGSGLSGFGQQLADLIGGLIGSADGELPDAGDTSEQDDPEPDAETEEPAGDEEAAADADPEEAAEETVEGPAPQPLPDPEPDTEPTATPGPLPPEPPPAPQGLPEAVAEPTADGTEPTPCEIAADELPQVGE